MYATEAEACDACAGREPVRITCTKHFLASLDDTLQNQEAGTCEACGWPDRRQAVDCPGHPVHRQWDYEGHEEGIL
jgi:hypothetical protein